jgi:non-canonical (house-cleaning) NTP pyrophosphatase
MPNNPKDFWRRLQTGVEVTVVSATPERLLGVRDAFVRYFQEGLQWPSSVVVVPQAADEPPQGLPVTDQESLSLARRQARQLMERLPDAYHFYVALQAGVSPLEVDGQQRYFLRNWTVVTSVLGEAWGGSGSLQLPDRFFSALDGEDDKTGMPGTRRRGGITSSLTGGLETRRQTVALSTFHALSTLCYGVLQSPLDTGP